MEDIFGLPVSDPSVAHQIVFRPLSALDSGITTGVITQVCTICDYTEGAIDELCFMCGMTSSAPVRPLPPIRTIPLRRTQTAIFPTDIFGLPIRRGWSAQPVFTTQRTFRSIPVSQVRQIPQVERIRQVRPAPPMYYDIFGLPTTNPAAACSYRR